jgi:hypothetical protein
MYEALRIIALRGAYKPDSESNLRYVMRWYSKTFHTPLHEVYDLPLEDIWMAFFEERYHDMEREDLEEEVRKALESPAAAREREMGEEVEKASELSFQKMSAMSNLAKKVNAIADKLKAPDTLPETAPPPVIEENIQMEFVDDTEMEKLMDGGMANQTKKSGGFFK